MTDLKPPMGPEVVPSPVAVYTMRKRTQFLACNNQRHFGTRAFVLQARDRRDGKPAVNVGFTCSRKVGNAVARNRAKRRLREIARLTLPTAARPGWDYVLIGRKDATTSEAFEALTAQLRTALEKIHGAQTSLGEILQCEEQKSPKSTDKSLTTVTDSCASLSGQLFS
ncbi:MAG: ribonuclease P protein component [Rhodobacteraceae bacterium]|nr:ribonuclease P protein component [Paracoccaceae bacterium]